MATNPPLPVQSKQMIKIYIYVQQFNIRESWPTKTSSMHLTQWSCSLTTSERLGFPLTLWEPSFGSVLQIVGSLQLLVSNQETQLSCYHVWPRDIPVFWLLISSGVDKEDQRGKKGKGDQKYRNRFSWSVEVTPFPLPDEVRSKQISFRVGSTV